ncbi:MAG: hypothetical protein ABL866_00095 [Devosia sp.]
MLIRSAATLIAIALAAFMLVPPAPASSEARAVFAELGLSTLLDSTPLY